MDGFWSVSVYTKDGFFETNQAKAYLVNNLTAKRNGDGSVTIQFGGHDGNTPNCLPDSPGWNYMVRLDRLQREIIDGTWNFSRARLVR